MDDKVNQAVTIDPDRRGGKPCIAGTRLTVTQMISELDPTGEAIAEWASDYEIDIDLAEAALNWAIKRINSTDTSWKRGFDVGIEVGMGKAKAIRHKVALYEDLKIERDELVKQLAITTNKETHPNVR